MCVLSFELRENALFVKRLLYNLRLFKYCHSSCDLCRWEALPCCTLRLLTIALCCSRPAGYLKETGCEATWRSFLDESPDLAEVRSLQARGRSVPGRIQGLSLLQILDEYSTARALGNHGQVELVVCTLYFASLCVVRQ